jgi:hypothetical protein
MGHHISAVLFKGPFNDRVAKSFDLKVIRLTPQITLFPLDAAYCGYWSEKLEVSGFLSGRALLNSNADGE